MESVEEYTVLNNNEVIEDDNVLVDINAKSHDETENKWTDSKLLEIFKQEVEKLKQVTFIENYPDSVLMMAVAEVVQKIGFDSYDNFQNTVRSILMGPRNGPHRIPFSEKTRNGHNNYKTVDFWLMKSFVEVGNNASYSLPDGSSFKKYDVLMSNQFNKFLQDYCKNVLNGETQFWVFSGAVKGKQRLDLTKIKHPEDLNLVRNSRPEDLVMVQFRKHVPVVKN